VIIEVHPMRADRYLKVVLTVIALELAWIGVKDFADPASAQGAPARVVIAGIEMDAAQPAYLPVAIVGSIKTIPQPLRTSIDPLSARINAPNTGKVHAMPKAAAACTNPLAHARWDTGIQCDTTRLAAG